MGRRLTAAVAGWSAPLYLGCCLVLGGASASGVVANAVLQLLAILIIALNLRVVSDMRLTASMATPFWLIAAAALLIAVQLVPLPGSVWPQLPGRAIVAHALDVEGSARPWLPISLAPDATIACLLSLLPPTAMLVAIYAASEQGRTRTILALLGLAALSTVVGAAQMAGPSGSLLYFYDVTNRGSAVGFFANRNHLGSLLLCGLPFLTTLPAVDCDNFSRRRELAACLVAATLFGCGVVMIGSIAAIAMLTPVLIVCGLLLLRMRNHFPGWIWLALAVAVAIAVGSVPLRFHKDDTGAGAQAQQRSVIIPTTWHAVHDHFPVGSGGGSFPLIYPFYEKPEAATPEYINHAHCDYMEVALEYGLAGILLILAAVGIGLLRIVPTWRLDGMAGARARASLAALAILAVASIVDYPLRTAALSALAGMAAAFLAAPLRPSSGAADEARRTVPGTRLSLSADEI